MTDIVAGEPIEIVPSLKASNPLWLEATEQLLVCVNQSGVAVVQRVAGKWQTDNLTGTNGIVCLGLEGVRIVIGLQNRVEVGTLEAQTQRLLGGRQRITIRRTEKTGEWVDAPSSRADLNNIQIDTVCPARGGSTFFTDPRSASAGGGLYVFREDGESKRIYVGESLRGIVYIDDTIYVSDLKNLAIIQLRVDDEFGTEVVSSIAMPKFAGQGPDGLALDGLGNLYGACKEGVIVFDEARKPVGMIPIRNASGCVFGGTDKKELFVTARDAIYLVPMVVQGR
ncbi:MAG: SMP-30/gluconolactonase/LRE family protein [Planctomycetes bacterium]|nr:SMP-30/gluconolactonase/LRE family protein [Planctomycetota bacterium]